MANAQSRSATRGGKKKLYVSISETLILYSETRSNNGLCAFRIRGLFFPVRARQEYGIDVSFGCMFLHLPLLRRCTSRKKKKKKRSGSALRIIDTPPLSAPPEASSRCRYRFPVASIFFAPPNRHHGKSPAAHEDDSCWAELRGVMLAT